MHKRTPSTPNGKLPIVITTGEVCQSVHWHEAFNDWHSDYSGWNKPTKTNLEWIDMPEFVGYGSINGFNQENLLTIHIYGTRNYNGVYRMRQKQLLEMLTTKDGPDIKGGVIRGNWTFVKGGYYGRQYSLRYLSR